MTRRCLRGEAAVDFRGGGAVRSGRAHRSRRPTVASIRDWRFFPALGSNLPRTKNPSGWNALARVGPSRRCCLFRALSHEPRRCRFAAVVPRVALVIGRYLLSPPFAGWGSPGALQVSVYRWDESCEPVASWGVAVRLPGPGSANAFGVGVEAMREAAGADRYASVPPRRSPESARPCVG